MSYQSKTGKIIGFSDTAIFDLFVGANVLEVTLLQGDGTESIARAPMGGKFALETAYNPNRLTPCIGDTVEIGWDYERFTGIVRKVSDASGVPMPSDLPIAGQSTTQFEDQLASLNPHSPQEHMYAEMLKLLLTNKGK